MTREPDRYEAKANAVYAAKDFENDPVGNIAAALRQAADDALERAAREAEALSSNYDKQRAEVADSIADAIRALASPAAAPAAEVCPICGDTGKTACKAPPSGPVAPSLLPRVLAALDEHGFWTLAAELRRYIGEMETGTERNVRDADSISLLQWKARARSAEAKWRSHMAALLTTIGGEVEGAPTADYNFLQRLRELTTKELLLAKLQARTAARSEGET